MATQGDAPEHVNGGRTPFRAFPVDPNPPIDAAHLARLATRATLATHNGVRVREEVRRTRRELVRAQENLRGELALVRTELAALQRESVHVVGRVESLVGEFRRLARAGDFARLQERADAQRMEQRVTRDELARLIADAQGR